jgi:hypothetical protein
MMKKLEVVATLLPLLAEMREAQAQATSAASVTVTAQRFDQWAEALESFLENAGQGSRSRGTIALEDLSSEND